MSTAVIGSEQRLTGQISWGAVFAGVVVVVITYVMLSVLGIAFGAGSIEPLHERNPISGLGTGSAVWLGLTSIIALFLGSWVAARTCGVTERTEAVLHGVITWALSSLVVVYMVVSAVGGMLSGVAGAVGQTVSLATRGAMALTPEIAKSVAGSGGDDVNWESIKQQATLLLKQSKKKDLQPSAIASASQKTAQNAKATANDMAKDPQGAGADLGDLWQQIESRGQRVINAADKEALANVIVARTEMTKPEAMATVERWQSSLENAKAQVANLQANAGQQIRQAADVTAEVVAKTATGIFLALLLGLVAAIAGGFFGCRQFVRVSSTYPGGNLFADRKATV